VSFPALGSPTPLQVAGRLSLPTKAEGKVPAVVIAHGSGGVDSRGSFHAEALHEAGFATLEIDMWAARGLSGGADGRPKAVMETLPDAYGALNDNPDSCQQLVEGLGPADRPLVELTVYPGATHAWDRLEPALQVSDPYSHTGQGGTVDIVPSPETALMSRRAVVAFFEKAFGLAH
jgi:dienelactone hydrolase